MAYPTVAVTGDPVPSDWQVNITLEVVEQFTEHSPAGLRTEFMNDAPTTRTFLSGLGPPFGPLVGHTERGERIHVIPDDDSNPSAGAFPSMVPQSPVDGCWQLNTSYGIDDVGIMWPAEPGATSTMTYAVLNDLEATDCLPIGEYRFEAEWGERYEDNEDVYHSWGFTLVLR